MTLASCLGVIIASIVAGFIFFTVLTTLIGGAVASFTSQGDEKPKGLSSNSVLLIDPVGSISDKPTSDPYEIFNSFSNEEDKEYTLQEVLRAIQIARENPDIDAIVLKLEHTGMGFATASEIREALTYFKESGKPIYAYADNYSLGSYYLSSVADKVYAGPEGTMMIVGLVNNTLFQKGLLNKLGVEMQVFKVGTFKGAVEPYILDKLSPENRLQMQEMLDGLWEGTTAEIANSRGIGREALQSFADNGLMLAKMQEAVEQHLVDSLIYPIDVDDTFAEILQGDKDADVNYLSIRDLLHYEKAPKTHDKIAVIYAEGEITIDAPEGTPAFGQRSNVINTSTVKQLRKAAEDDDVKAIVLRVNSPGGVVTTSELICHEVQQIKGKKPIVVSMGNMAASGGYYISSHADMIVADAYTLTGSIGIFGMIPNLAGTMQKLGLKSDMVSTSEMAEMAITQPLSEHQKALMQKYIEQGYDTFLTRVSTGRGMTKEAVDAVGQGRVWLGMRALEHGLVDKLGGLYTAIDEAARLAELSEFRVVHQAQKENIWSKLFSGKARGAIHYLSLSPEERIMYELMQLLRSRSGVLALSPYDLTQVVLSPATAYTGATALVAE